MRGTIKDRNYQIEYLQFGRGPRIMFAFHGFNNIAAHFSFLEKFIGDEFTIVAVNLFFHGESHAHDSIVEKGLEAAELKSIFESLTEKFPASKYSLLGYSLGGRISLFLTSMFPVKIDLLVLIAPDGLKVSPFYRLVTQNAIGRKFLKWVIDKPAAFFQTGKILRRLNFISVKRHQFALNNFDTRDKREKVYRVWLAYRKIHFDSKYMKDLILKYKIPVLMFFGKHDNIIPPSIGYQFEDEEKRMIKVTVLDAGHRLLTEATGKEIARQIAGLSAKK